MRSSPRQALLGDRGFTLIELLLSMVIFAVVLSAVNGVFYGALQLRQRTTEKLERSLPVEHAATVLRRDLSNLVMPGGTLAGTFKSGSSVDSMGVPAAVEWYTSTGSVDDRTPWAEVIKVSYGLIAPTNGAGMQGMDLVRQVTRNLLANTTDVPEMQRLLSHVQSLEFSFYDGTQWHTTWDSETEASVVPKAVKVVVELASNDAASPGSRLAARVEAPLHLVVPVMLTASTNQTSTTGGQQ